MLPEGALKAAIAGLPTRPQTGAHSRFVSYQFLVPVRAGVPPATGPKPLWGIGSIRVGGRFTPKGSFETIYLAEDPITALAEVEVLLKGFGGVPKTAVMPPTVHVAVDVLVLSVLDLTEPAVQAATGTTRQELTGDWRPTQIAGAEAPTQLLGRVGYESGTIQAIRYYSAKNQPDGRCLAVFPERLNNAAFLEVFDPFGTLAQRVSTVP